MRTPIAAVFLDKDGTLIEDVPYSVAVDQMQFTPGAAQGLARLHRGGFAIVVVSNQSGVARGYFPESALVPVSERLRDMVEAAGAELAGFYYCPHFSGGCVEPFSVPCICRKPAPGLLTKAAAELHIDLAASWLIGDILDDIEAGHAAGCQAVLLDHGSETEWRLSQIRTPDLVVEDLSAAADVILAERGRDGALCETAAVTS